MARYNKPPTTVAQQITILMDRGLLIEDLEQAKKQLQVIGYYRLSGYFKAFQINERFNNGITFQRIIQLYDNDRRLRCCLLGAIERIEIAVKALLDNHIA
ncbi:MAG: Abi family protein [Proteobacteria bacterium]|nr:Abi family protein [Pseudomonadota bacterium]